MTFEEFLAGDQVNPHIIEDGLEMYVRKCRVWPGLIHIGTVNARKRGAGAYTRFMKRYDHLHPFYFENTLNERLADWHRRLGHYEIPCDMDIPSFLNQVAMDRGLGPVHKVLT